MLQKDPGRNRTFHGAILEKIRAVIKAFSDIQRACTKNKRQIKEEIRHNYYS